ncbi:hypothetical protein Ptr902_10862 [Pyrenophora tritici-repentis]|nr:hypothetical protein Ptr902_10862 [Pyrenophora tritici-repentis]
MELQILVRILGSHNDFELFKYAEQSVTLIRKALLVEQDGDLIEGQRYMSLELLHATSKKKVKGWRAFHESVYTHFTVPPLLRALLTRGTRAHRRWFEKKSRLLNLYQELFPAYIRRVDQKIDTTWDQAELIMRIYYDCHEVVLSEAATYTVVVIIAVRMDKDGGMKALVDEIIAEMVVQGRDSQDQQDSLEYDKSVRQ